MDLVEYQKAAGRTSPRQYRRSNCALGLIGEFGEVVEIIKKAEHHGHQLDRAKLASEIGDVMWYIAEGASINDEELSTHGLDYDKWSVVYIAQSIASQAASLQNGGGDYHEHLVAQMQTLCRRYGIDFDDVLVKNIAKLEARYPEGFCEAASVARSDP